VASSHQWPSANFVRKSFEATPPAPPACLADHRLRFRLMVKRGHRCTGPKHQKEKRSMDYFAGLDVSVKDTSVCIVDDTGKTIREVTSGGSL
jgi:hypothetical protein